MLDKFDLLKYYISQLHELLEKPRNELEKKYINRKNKKIDKVIKEYDKTLLEKYRYIEKVMDEELSEKE